jgi:hypothetical protein
MVVAQEVTQGANHPVAITNAVVHHHLLQEEAEMEEAEMAVADILNALAQVVVAVDMVVAIQKRSAGNLP